MKQITIDDVMALRPCYSREELEAVAGGRQSLTILEVCDVTAPPKDILWLLLREEFLPAALLHAFACDCAERALLREREAGREPDPRSWAAIETKRRWLQGEASNEELDAARGAALAARAAAWAAAWAAWEVREAREARAAAWEAATAAALAARAVAEAAAGKAARVACAAALAVGKAARVACAAALAVGKAAEAAARETDWETEREWQLKHLRELIEGSE